MRDEDCGDAAWLRKGNYPHLSFKSGRTWIEDYCKRTPKEQRIGRCYELAFKGLCREWPLLVQGYIHYEGRACVHHAWLESETEVFDPVMDLRVSLDAYYRLFQPQDGVTLTKTQAQELVLLTGHYGPWQEVDDERIKLLKPMGGNQ